ncbi:MAG: hypothetical protein PHX83_10815 [Acidobacteriia bacterium]|nr:hypothetical protein [Terriglobia bacterium]
MLRNCFLMLMILSMTASTLVAAEADPLAPLNFLLGRWEGAGGGTPGQGGGFSEFTKDLQGRVIVRRNSADYPATSNRPAYSHNDLMIIYCDASKTLRADYYDNEGHVIRYAIHTDTLNGVVFVSDPLPKEPRYRLTYKPSPAGQLEGKFEIAPPGKPETFSTYLSWTMRKTK